MLKTNIHSNMKKFLSSVIKNVRYDIESIMKRDPAASSALEVILLYPSFTAVRDYRAAHWFHKNGYRFIARIISQNSRFRTGIEIHPGAKIGRGFFIDHGSGVVIGETAEIGNNCTVYQNVTLGGTGKEHGKRHPTIGNNVMIGSGAKVLGNIKIGNNVKIAANAVVVKSIPDDCTAVGVPARIVRRNGKKVSEKNGVIIDFDLDQVHFEDPVETRLSELAKNIESIEKEIKEFLPLLSELAEKCDKLKRK